VSATTGGPPTSERPTREHQRLADSEARRADWKNWGPYLAERAWGTVREDYSPDGQAWSSFPHDHARSRAYRWNEDGLGGVCNRFQNICLGLALWNGRDPILKERLFGLTGDEGNHGEDVKEHYWYLDSTPTHSLMKMRYRYPQVAFPYRELVDRGWDNGRTGPEIELSDVLGEALSQGRFFDVDIEWAKAGEQDLLCLITAHNRGPDDAPLHVLPHVWFRNRWDWGYDRPRPHLRGVATDLLSVELDDPHLGRRWWWMARDDDPEAALLFTDNSSNRERLWDQPNPTPWVKDAFHRRVVQADEEAVNPAREGTKACGWTRRVVPAGGSVQVKVRFADIRHAAPFADFEAIFAARRREADAFYDAIHAAALGPDARRVQRQALAGLLWTKQFYHFRVQRWHEGDPAGPRPAQARKSGRNAGWEHVHAMDVMSMPDKWEYPWFAAWDTAFHTLPLAMVDPEWAKRQLTLLLREWYMHPNGQLPAYEWAFGDVNPPVHAWACWRVYKIARNVQGYADTDFLEATFHKLLINFTWWVNRKDRGGNNVFQGGFLGLDNVGVFDRSKPLPTGGYLEQADGTAWMAMYCLNMLAIALELACTRPAYEDMATKFFEHFIRIANAIGDLRGLWDEQDGFFYDTVHLPDGGLERMRVLSFVGLIPLFAVETLEPEVLERLPRFRRRMQWFIDKRPNLVSAVASLTTPGRDGRRLLALVDTNRLRRVLTRMFDPQHFLSNHGLRSLSRWHARNPYVLCLGDRCWTVRYEPGESRSGMFGGNSNWRGPVWLPVNYLMIESLEKFHHYYGDALKVTVPGPGGRASELPLDRAAQELSARLCGLFAPDNGGHRPALAADRLAREAAGWDPHWQRDPLFYEYFNGDTGAGLGASHQTGWTALIARLLDKYPGAGRTGEERG